jgi:hypothetical protein
MIFLISFSQMAGTSPQITPNANSSTLFASHYSLIILTFGAIIALRDSIIK